MRGSGFNAQGKQKSYLPLKFCGDDDTYGVYAISEVPFPSHIRTLLPASENHMLEYMELERARRRLRTVIITLAVFAVFATLLSVSLVLGFQQKAEDVTTQLPSQPKMKWKAKELQTVVVPLNSSHNSSSSSSYSERMPAYVVKSRTRCVKTCWAYSAFRFRSTCDHGYCFCKAVDYDPLTCLPVVDNCSIRKNVGAKAVAVLQGKRQRVFGCHSDVEKPEVADLHVLSIFGNHWSHVTRVETTGNASQPVIIALVNYHPVTWKLHLRPEVLIEKVILVSYNHLSRTSVVFEGSDNDGVDISSPEVMRLYSQTGYGEDRYGGHTPAVIKNIQSQFGKVRTFYGTSHADEWYLDLS